MRKAIQGKKKRASREKDTNKEKRSGKGEKMLLSKQKTVNKKGVGMHC